MPAYERLRSIWSDDPRDPARPVPSHPNVDQLLRMIAPDDVVTDLGGTISLNLHLRPSNLVVRVHRPFVSPARLLGEQALRRYLKQTTNEILAAEPIAMRGKTILRCGKRWAEVEPFLNSSQPNPSLTSYRWLFAQLGRLHRVFSSAEVGLPRSMAATWAPPSSLARWIQVTIPALSVTSEGALIAQRLQTLSDWVRQGWVSPSTLPIQLIHGDFRLGNLVRAPNGSPIVFDFGFAGRRPAVHDLAYSLAFMVLDLAPTNVTPFQIGDMVDRYTSGRGQRLRPLEQRAIPAYAASVMLYSTAHAGFTADPSASLEHHGPFLDVASWFIAHSTAIQQWTT